MTVSQFQQYSSDWFLFERLPNSNTDSLAIIKWFSLFKQGSTWSLENGKQSVVFSFFTTVTPFRCDKPQCGQI